MKKLYLILIAILITFTFSCASKDSAEDLTDIQAPSDQENLSAQEESQEENSINLENQDLTESEKEDNSQVTISQESEENSNENSDQTPENQISTENEEEINSSEKESLVEESSEEDFPPLEVIEEPLVIDLEAPEEIVEEDEKAEELTKEDLQEIQADLEENKNPEEDTLISLEETNEEKTENQASTEDSVIDIENITGTGDDDGVEFLDLDPNNIVLEVSDEPEADLEETEEKEIKPSRSITLKRLEYLDVTYPGKGWIYMGLTDNSKDITYFGRKILPGDTKFSLQAKIEGKKILHFYKEDTLTGEYIDDYIEVIVEKEKGSSKTHIEAPKYIPQIKKESKKIKKEIVNQDSNNEKEITSQESKKNNLPNDNDSKSSSVNVKEENSTNSISKNTVIKNQNENTTNLKTVENTESPLEIQTSDQEVEVIEELDLSKLYDDAVNYFNEKKYQEALNSITLYLHNARDKRDAALYLQGQIYEADSDIQNINKAIDAYTMLTSNFPASSYWDKANKQIIYLKRFYLEGR
ncbi:MAG: hypothetical protein K5866_04985 [Treponema sp.]|nr:hypothetical protein [Treponema sp.]